MTDTIRPVDIVVSLLDKTHQVKITWRPDLKHTVSPTGLEGARWLHDGNGWTVPALNAHALLPYFRDNFPQCRVSFDQKCAQLIQSQLEREAATSVLALAEDGDVPDVLSVPSKPFQRACVSYLLRDKPRKIVALPTGTGKTFVANAYSRIKQSRTLWITMTPLRTNLKREVRKLTGQSATVLMGTNPTTESIRILQDKSIQHIIMSYDSIARSIVEEKDDDGKIVLSTSLWALAILASDFDLMICDEAHTIRNRSTAAWKAVNMLKSIPSVLFMTATPVVNSGLDLYSLLTILDHNTFSSVSEFTRTYLSADGKRVLNPRKLQHDLLPYMFRRKKEDIMKDLPPKIRQHHNIKLSDYWQSQYDAVLRGIYQDMKGNIYDVPDVILAQMNRFRQIAENAKVEHTAELAMKLEEDGEKCIIFTCFKESGEALRKELSCDFISGDDTDDERYAKMDKFQNDKNVKHLVLMIQVGGTGYNLTAATATLFNGFFWHDAAHTQAEDRAHGRLSDVHGTLVYYTVVDDSIDEHIIKIIMRKQELAKESVDGIKSFATEQVSIKTEFLRYLKEHGA
jgi:SNF2 family DNA or RNA helicase